MNIEKRGNMSMNPLLGTLMIFSGIILTFFGLPIAGLFVMSQISPPKLQPVGLGTPLDTSQPMETPQPVSIPITIKKIRHKGNFVWVDA